MAPIAGGRSARDRLNGVVGDASVATAPKGEALLRVIAQAVADALTEPRFWSAPI